MGMSQTAPKSIDEYIAGFPEDVQEILQQIRKTIREAAPEAKTTVGASWKEHIASIRPATASPPTGTYHPWQNTNIRRAARSPAA